MPDGMTKVQQCALSLLRRVVLYNFALDLTASGDHLFHDSRLQCQNSIMMCHQPFIVSGILDKTVFYNLSHPGNDLPGRKGVQDGQVHIDQFGLIKSTHHIFVLHKVHAGLPADAAVYLGKQRGRHLDKINAAQVGCCCKSGEITYNASA